ncbi:Ig-like domain-containing protein, partial [Acinetobacter ursingii]|uniref:Ig-like domain-containing protein n=1 Tax=Acinetobacter ursingii TaxID=108980 RepID=UPI0011AFDBDE
KDVTVTGNDDGSLNITGNTEPGADVTVTLPDGSTITGKADENGNIDIKVPSPAAEGDYSVVVKDQAGNESPVSDVTYSDSVAPAAPTANINHAGTEVTGTAEAGSMVIVRDAKNNIVGQIIAGNDGTYKVTLSPAVNNGEELVVTATDSAGNVSSETEITAPDITPPAAIIDIVSISDDTGISDSDFITSDTSLTINGKLTGTLETNEHAQISIDGGATWLDLTVDTEGQWSFVDDRTLTNGNYDYAVRVVDDAGNVGSTDSQTVVVDASVPVNSITVDTLFSADTTPTITGTYANAMKGNDFIQVTVNGKTYTQGDGYLTVNTTNKTWSLQIPDTDAMNVAGNADVKYDITAEIIAAAGGKVADATSEELTIFKNVSINAGPNPDYVDQKPLLNGLIKLGTNESLEVKIYDNDGVLVRTFSSINGANSIDGLTIDTVANTWKIVNANWGANQLEGGNYTAKASVVTKDGSGGQSSTDQAITVIEPKVIPVDNKADDSDIGSKIYALDDGGYLLVWAQNQTKSTETNGTSNYDLVAQRYDQTGQKVGGFIKITDTPTGGSANSEGYGDRMDMWDSYGGFNVYIDANSHLTIAYTASQGQKGFVKVYDDAMNLLSTSQVSGGDYYFGFNTVATSNGNVVVYTSGTLQNYNVYFSGSNNNYATSTKLTNETNGGNGYIYGASQTPAGAAIGNKASNIESLSAISLGGSKVLIQYADFTATNINPTKQNLMVVDYASDGKATIVTSMVANIFDNGWQVGAKSFALKEGGFVSLWASNHESATAATGTAAKGTMDGFDVYARRFNYDDVTKTITALDAQEKRVNTTTDGVNGVGYSTMATGHMSGVALEHGGYVIVWTKMLSNTLSEVYSQSFDAAGNKLGGETLVSTQTVDGTGSVDTLPYVAALADGGYVVTWTNSNQDYKVNSLTADIKSVIVNADGSIRGEGEAPSMSAKYLTGEGELIGTDGVNTLDGRHGATVMEAGNGNDYIIIKDTNFDLIDGGTGSDTLVWDSKADLNLGDILSKVNSIETIHLGDENANTLTISIDDLLSISSTDMLVVQGGDTDLVKLVDQDGWVSAGTQTYRGEVYQVYTHQENIDAMLWIQHNIDVIG